MSGAFRNQMYVVGQVRRCPTRQGRKDETRQLKVNSSLDWKPVQLAQHWRDVISTSGSGEKPSSGILDGLQRNSYCLVVVAVVVVAIVLVLMWYTLVLLTAGCYLL